MIYIAVILLLHHSAGRLMMIMSLLYYAYRKGKGSKHENGATFLSIKQLFEVRCVFFSFIKKGSLGCGV